MGVAKKDRDRSRKVLILKAVVWPGNCNRTQVAVQTMNFRAVERRSGGS
jgi:hypothetical protein